MSLIWREQLSVGNNVIDDDHKYLIDLINQAGDCLDASKRGELTEVLDKLARYSTRHFANEEKIADCAGYTRVAQLHQSHEVLLTQLEQVRQEVLGETTAESMERFATFLKDWLLNHVIREDLLMKPVLSKHAPTFDPR